jgi:pimeloyl-ACP methyl ester carboxylesterase
MGQCSSTSTEAKTSYTACLKRGMIDTFLGSIAYHIIEANPSSKNNYTQHETIVCLHSSPRSSDEFLDIMPYIALANSNGNKTRTVIALDCPGYGHSENPLRSCTLEEIGTAYLHVLYKLKLIDSIDVEEYKLQQNNNSMSRTKHKRIILFGSLMGNFISLSIASRCPTLVSACVLINLYYFPKKETYAMPKIYSTSENNTKENPTEEKEKMIPDPWELKEDGSMLAELFTKRPWAGNELNLRIVHSEISYLMNRRHRYQKGITIEDLPDVDLEPPARKTVCPVLCVKGKLSLEFLDMIGLHGTQQFDKAVSFLGDCEVRELAGEGSNINLVNQMPDELAMLINDFLMSRV